MRLVMSLSNKLTYHRNGFNSLNYCVRLETHSACQLEKREEVLWENINFDLKI